MKKLVFVIIAVLILAGAAAFIVYKFHFMKPQPVVYVDKKTELFINAKRLWVDYSMNKDIAAPKYDGKIIEITGSIMRVETVKDSTVVVFAYRKGANGDEGIRVTMIPQFSQAAKGINPFKNVKIKGLCKGYNGQDVIMKDGSIVGSQ
jgi:hypothetical protein